MRRWITKVRLKADPTPAVRLKADATPAVRLKPDPTTPVRLKPDATTAILVCSAVILVCVALATARAQPAVIALTNGRVLDVVAGRYQAAGAVVIRGERIEAILASAQGLPSGTRRIDVAGGTLVPGLGDLYARGAPAGDLDADYFYALALAHGVTFGRLVNVRLPWGVEQRARVRAGAVLAPRFWLSGPGLEQRADAEGRPQPRGTRAPGPTVEIGDLASAAREVDAQARAGVDWIAVDGNVGPDLHMPIVAAARAAKLRISAAPGSASMAQLAQGGVDLIDGLGSPLRTRQEYERAYFARPDAPRDPMAFADYVWGQTSQADVRALVTTIGRARTAVGPMLARTEARAVPEQPLQDPAVELLPPATRQALKQPRAPADTALARAALKTQRVFVADLQRAGVRMVTAAGTDESGYPVPGSAIHAELRALVAAGLTPADAVRAATIGAATLLGAEAVVGQIKEKFFADLFVVEGDPLQRVEDLSRVRLVIRGGEVLDRADLLRQAGRATRIVK